MTKQEHNNMKSKLANVVGGKSARACDNCVRKRARWYCAADDAFLCQSCDSSVHSANPLARRHERVRLKTSSIPPDENQSKPNQSSCWHNGFTKKARTPRQKKHAKVWNHPLRLVPEISSKDNNSNEDNDEQLLYRVPIFDPFHSEFGNPDEPLLHRYDQSKANEVLQNFIPSEMDLTEFAADVESLLGTGLEDETFDMESLGLLDSERVKSEQEELLQVSHRHELELIDIGKETFELSFDYDCGEEEDTKAAEQPIMTMNDLGSCNKVDHHHESKKNMLLRLNYQSVLSAWDEHKSPWTNGERPELDDSADCWPACMGTCGRIHVYGDMGQMMAGHVTIAADGGREARVSRYREKRRTRLFSKKIRYEVRKLNAEKRPRMKGRFVKRANLVASGLPLLKT